MTHLVCQVQLAQALRQAPAAFLLAWTMQLERVRAGECKAQRGGKPVPPHLRAVGAVPRGDLGGDGALFDHGGAGGEEAARGKHTAGDGEGRKGERSTAAARLQLATRLQPRFARAVQRLRANTNNKVQARGQRVNTSIPFADVRQASTRLRHLLASGAKQRCLLGDPHAPPDGQLVPLHVQHRLHHVLQELGGGAGAGGGSRLLAEAHTVLQNI